MASPPVYLNGRISNPSMPHWQTVSAFPFHSLSSSLKLNALLHETLSNTPHSCPCHTPASTSCERLVYSMHSRRMLLESTCRVRYLGIYTNCQCTVAVPYPSLTSFTFAYTFGPCKCDFGYYHCSWLDNFNDMRPDKFKPRYPDRVRGQ